jgi:hypothetical protein
MDIWVRERLTAAKKKVKRNRIQRGPSGRLTLRGGELSFKGRCSCRWSSQCFSLCGAPTPNEVNRLADVASTKPLPPPNSGPWASGIAAQNSAFPRPNHAEDTRSSSPALCDDAPRFFRSAFTNWQVSALHLFSTPILLRSAQVTPSFTTNSINANQMSTAQKANTSELVSRGVGIG